MQTKAILPRKYDPSLVSAPAHTCSWGQITSTLTLVLPPPRISGFLPLTVPFQASTSDKYSHHHWALLISDHIQMFRSIHIFSRNK